jgi:hypothetical protein
MGESDDVASGRRNGGASPLLVWAWSLVAEEAVKSGAQTTLTACGVITHGRWVDGG